MPFLSHGLGGFSRAIYHANLISLTSKSDIRYERAFCTPSTPRIPTLRSKTDAELGEAEQQATDSPITAGNLNFEDESGSIHLKTLIGREWILKTIRSVLTLLRSETHAVVWET